VNGRVLAVAALTGWAGATLLLSQLRWFSRISLGDRLRPYAPGGMARTPRAGVLSVDSFREAIGPVARTAGARLARLVGINEDIGIRLNRVHSTLDVTSFRVRQVGYCVGGFGAGAMGALALQLGPLLTLAFLLGSPVLAFLLTEQRLASASQRWQRDLFLELPVVAEQLGMLLAAGWSLTSGLNRLASRGTGVMARDLERVCRRGRQGVGEAQALREWAQLADVPALSRLVPVLCLNRDTGDLGRLIAEEARAIRRDVHRELIEMVERRNQQVWIPVTVSALVPGVLFLAIPFVEALRLFGG
jgi:tight adherence protein C